MASQTDRGILLARSTSPFTTGTWMVGRMWSPLSTSVVPVTHTHTQICNGHMHVGIMPDCHTHCLVHGWTPSASHTVPSFDMSCCIWHNVALNHIPRHNKRYAPSISDMHSDYYTHMPVLTIVPMLLAYVMHQSLLLRVQVDVTLHNTDPFLRVAISGPSCWPLFYFIHFLHIPLPLYTHDLKSPTT